MRTVSHPVLNPNCPVGASPQMRPEGAQGGEAAGLVYSKTTHTRTLAPPLDRMIKVDQARARQKKIQCATLTAARLHVEQSQKGGFRMKCAMATLTYEEAVEWVPGQFEDMATRVRNFLKRRKIPFRYVWVQEFTRRGRPHYHVLIWLPKGITLPKPDKQGWWPHGSTRIEWVRNAVGYIAKYCSKASDLVRPAEGARMYGSGGLTGTALLEQRWWKMPKWVREVASVADAPCRHVGGGILLKQTGEVLRSPWHVAFKGGHVYLWREEPPPRGEAVNGNILSEV